MNRRKFVKASVALSALSGMTGLSSLFAQSAWADDGIADGKAVRFDFDVLKQKAAALAKKPWGGAPGALPDTLATLTPQAYNEIQYDAQHSLWNNVADRELDREAREIHFRPELFKYHDAGVDTQQLAGKNDLGFAGFRAF